MRLINIAVSAQRTQSTSTGGTALARCAPHTGHALLMLSRHNGATAQRNAAEREYWGRRRRASSELFAVLIRYIVRRVGRGERRVHDVANRPRGRMGGHARARLPVGGTDLVVVVVLGALTCARASTFARVSR
eukprot:7245349-Prymnesium_polylepis.2